MSPSRPAARSQQRHAASTAHARARLGPAPRRVSGPTVRGGAVALPGRRRRGATGTFERVLRLPDHRMVDRLLRGRAWIWLVGILLGGIVAMQVSLLKLNSGISRAVESAATLERQNSALEASIAKLSSSERIREGAEARGMIMPPAGQVEYVTVRPKRDSARAVARMRPPSDSARQLMANGGLLPGSLPAAAPAATTTTTTAPAATTTTAPTNTTPAGTGVSGTGAAAGVGTTGTAATGTAPNGASAGATTPPITTTAGGTAPAVPQG